MRSRVLSSRSHSSFLALHPRGAVGAEIPAKKNATRRWHLFNLLGAQGSQDKRCLISAQLVGQLDAEQTRYGSTTGLTEVLVFTVTQYLQYSNVIHHVVAEGCDLDVLLRIGPSGAKV